MVRSAYAKYVVLFCAQLRRPARPGDIPMDGGKNGCFPILTPVLDPVPPLSLPLSFSPLLSSPPACPGARPSVSVADVNSCVMSRHIAIPIQPSLSLSLSLSPSLARSPSVILFGVAHEPADWARAAEIALSSPPPPSRSSIVGGFE